MNSKIEALRARKADGGFTLIEMLIVIVVLGILAGITVFGVAQFRTDAEAAACDASAKTMNVAAQAYFAKNDAQPTLAQLGAGYVDLGTPAALPNGVTYAAGVATCTL